MKKKEREKLETFQIAVHRKLCELEKQLWLHENPPKFKAGQKVNYSCMESWGLNEIKDCEIILEKEVINCRNTVYNSCGNFDFFNGFQRIYYVKTKDRLEQLSEFDLTLAENKSNKKKN